MKTTYYTDVYRRLRREISLLQNELKSIETTPISGRLVELRKHVSLQEDPKKILRTQDRIIKQQEKLLLFKRKRAALGYGITLKIEELQEELLVWLNFARKKNETLKHEVKRRNAHNRRKENELLAAFVHSLRQETVKPSPDKSMDSAYDAFISYASEDKEDIVRLLAEQLRTRGYKIWYDEFQLKVGDSLRQSIDLGLRESRFGIVILSPAFFQKNWTQYELNALTAKELLGGKVILPIWHHVSKDEVLNYSLALADKFALNTAAYTMKELVATLSEVLRND